MYRSVSCNVTNSVCVGKTQKLRLKSKSKIESIRSQEQQQPLGHQPVPELKSTCTVLVTNSVTGDLRAQR